MSRRRNKLYKKQYIPNFNKMYDILGGLPDLINEDLEQLFYICNSRCTNFIDFQTTGKKLRFSTIGAIHRKIWYNFKGRASVYILGFSSVDRYGKEGVYIVHELY